ncbi:MAG: MBL fold metallo-hydrolase [Anaerolineae bacterium]|jgi:L-ascorbate 6-phosphate lactonase|nr:MBL fold metallo-hydrolase [Anaerolineae bacterium]
MSDVLTWDRSFLDEVEGTASPAGLLLWALGGPGFALRTRTALLWIDPYFGGTPPDAPAGLHRALAIPIDPTLIRRADAVLSTHAHIDHCHDATLLPLSQHTGARFIGPATSAAVMRAAGIAPERIDQVAAGDRLVVGDAEIITCGAHDPAEAGAVSFIIRSGGCTLFFAGDTQDTPLLEAVGASYTIDLALLAYGEPWYLSAENLLQAARRLRPRRLLPFHWDIWRGFSGNLGRFFSVYAAQACPFGVHILQMGDCLRLTADS